jgi:hypothetical protein
MSTENHTGNPQDQQPDSVEAESPNDTSVLIRQPIRAKPAPDKAKQPENKIIRLLEKNPLGMTLPEMAGGPRQVKKIRLLRPLLAEAIRNGLVMPVSQRAGNTVYRLVKNLGPR